MNILELITDATKELTPNHVDFERIDDDVLAVYVVSAQFEGMPMSKRFETISALMEENAPSLADAFTLMYQAWTKAEMEEE